MEDYPKVRWVKVERDGRVVMLLEIEGRLVTLYPIGEPTPDGGHLIRFDPEDEGWGALT
jgi:hypothetical protein